MACIYIDPPYNTGDDGFLYKDNLNHSTWMSFLNDRVFSAYTLLSREGSFFSQIDYKELSHLRLILEDIFNTSNFVQLISIKTASPAGFKTVNPGPIDVTEYLLFLVKNKSLYGFKKAYVSVEYDSNYNLYIENPDDEPQKWKLTSIIDKFYRTEGINGTADAKKLWGDHWKAIRHLMIGEFALSNKNRIVSKRDPHKPTDKIKSLLKKSKNIDNVIMVEREEINPLYIYKGGSLSFYSNKVKEIDGKVGPTELLTDFWDDISWAGIAKEGGVKLKNGKKPEKLLKRVINLSPSNKGHILDFFSGSGTTLSVAHKMNKKWIGIEVAEYFKNHTLKRLKNVLSGDQTGISEYVNYKFGGSFKYLRLESYEDTLNNLEVQRNEQQTSILEDLGMREEYMLHYMLDVESSGSLLHTGVFRKPFGYTIKTTEHNEQKETEVDLVETFNYLIGLEVESIQLIRGYVVVTGTTNTEGEKTLVIWRDLDVHGNEALNAFFEKMQFSTRDSEFDRIYVNGDNNLQNLKSDAQQWKVSLIEEEFHKRMFDIKEL